MPALPSSALLGTRKGVIAELKSTQHLIDYQGLLSWITRSLYPDCGQGVNRLAEQGIEEYRRMKVDFRAIEITAFIILENPRYRFCGFWHRQAVLMY